MPVPTDNNPSYPNEPAPPASAPAAGTVPSSDLLPTSVFNASATVFPPVITTAIVNLATAIADATQNPSTSSNVVVTALAARATVEFAIATPVPTDTPFVVDAPTASIEQMIVQQAATATREANAGAPNLVYTYTQQTNGNGEHIIAACVWNVGTAAASDVDVQFVASDPALCTAVRIPSEHSEFNDQQVKVRIASLDPGFLKEIEVVVTHIVEAPLPQWVRITIPQARVMDQPGDIALPSPCAMAELVSAVPIRRDFVFEVGSRYDVVDMPARPEPVLAREREREREPDRNPIPTPPSPQAVPPAFSSVTLSCLIGLILAALLVVGLLSGERNKRRQKTSGKPPRQQQRVSA